MERICATMKSTRALANRIANEMFKNGAGKWAKRLVLHNEDAQDIGGWGILPFADKVHDILKQELKGYAIVRKPKAKP
jgi:hypothetical protein